MATLVKSPCIGCRFAEWQRTKSGALHPNKLGRCTWRPKIEPMPWWAHSEKKLLSRLTAGWIGRDDVEPSRYYAACDAREDGGRKAAP